MFKIRKIHRVTPGTYTIVVDTQFNVYQGKSSAPISVSARIGSEMSSIEKKDWILRDIISLAPNIYPQLAASPEGAIFTRLDHLTKVHDILSNAFSNADWMADVQVICDDVPDLSCIEILPKDFSKQVLASYQAQIDVYEEKSKMLEGDMTSEKRIAYVVGGFSFNPGAAAKSAAQIGVKPTGGGVAAGSTSGSTAHVWSGAKRDGDLDVDTPAEFGYEAQSAVAR